MNEEISNTVRYFNCSHVRAIKTFMSTGKFFPQSQCTTNFFNSFFLLSLRFLKIIY